MKSDRRAAELAGLFGRGVLHQARLTDPADLDLTAEQMDAVHDAADDLLKLSGNPKAQVELVRSLDPQTRLILCMWVTDTGLMDSLLLRVAAPVIVPVSEVSR